jgi:transglutaminase-like putative cysteine protease
MDEDRANQNLNNHLAEIAAAGQVAAEAGGSPIVLPKRFRIRYALTVKPAAEQTDATLMREGSQLRVWLPFPQEYRQQSDVSLVSAMIDGEPYEPFIAPNATNFDGPGAISGAPQRTTYFEVTVTDPEKPIVFEEIFEYTMAGHYPVITAENTRELTDDERSAFAHYLAERPPHIAFNPELVSLTKQLIGDETNPYLKAKAIFDWWDANIRWMPELEYATIPSFANLCMQRKRGDCGVQAVTMMSMMRVAGIPARWQSGFTTTPGKENLHDWSEVYLPPHGWVVADPSYAYRTSDNPDVRNFYLGHIDAYRIIVNLDYGRELQPPKNSLRSEPADFQRGEVEVDGVNLYFDDWKWDYDVQSIEPLE